MGSTKKKRKRRNRLAEEIVALVLGTVFALMLGAIFYGVMAYQSADDEVLREAEAAQAPMPTAAPLAQGVDMAGLFPGQLMALGAGTLTGERAEDVRVGGEVCRAVTRTYALGEGVEVELVSAYPAAYAERMAAEGYVPQLVTGFAMAGLSGVYAAKDGQGMLMARDGDCVYMLLMEDDQSLAYSLGAGATL